MKELIERQSLRLHKYSERWIHMGIIVSLLKWIVLGGLVGILTGSASGSFLASLDWANETRNTHSWLLWLLPIGGALVSYLYLKFGKDSSKVNNLILEQIHEGKGTVPF